MSLTKTPNGWEIGGQSLTPISVTQYHNILSIVYQNDPVHTSDGGVLLKETINPLTNHPDVLVTHVFCSVCTQQIFRFRDPESGELTYLEKVTNV